MDRILSLISIILQEVTVLLRAANDKNKAREVYRQPDRRVDKPAFDRSRARRGSSLDVNPFMPHHSDPSPTSWYEDNSSSSSSSYDSSSSSSDSGFYGD